MIAFVQFRWIIQTIYYLFFYATDFQMSLDGIVCNTRLLSVLHSTPDTHPPLHTILYTSSHHLYTILYKAVKEFQQPSIVRYVVRSIVQINCWKVNMLGVLGQSNSIDQFDLKRKQLSTRITFSNLILETYKTLPTQ